MRAAVSLYTRVACLDTGLPAPLRMRVGIHQGEAQLRDGDYYGPPINRCARIRSAGHGGQVLLSEEAVCALGAEARVFTFERMGDYVLSGLRMPETVYQLVHPDLDTPQRPLRATPRVARPREALIAAVLALASVCFRSWRLAPAYDQMARVGMPEPILFGQSNPGARFIGAMAVYIFYFGPVILLLVAGIGLVLLRSWGRPMMITLRCAMLAQVPLMALIGWVIQTFPSMLDFRARGIALGSSQAIARQFYGISTFLLVEISVSAVTFWLLTRPVVIAAFRPQFNTSAGETAPSSKRRRVPAWSAPLLPSAPGANTPAFLSAWLSGGALLSSENTPYLFFAFPHAAWLTLLCTLGGLVFGVYGVRCAGRDPALGATDWAVAGTLISGIFILLVAIGVLPRLLFLLGLFLIVPWVVIRLLRHVTAPRAA